MSKKKKSPGGKEELVILTKEDLEPGMLPKLLKEARQARRLSLRHLGDLVGCSHVFLSKVERGLKEPSAYLWARLVDVLDIENHYKRAQTEDVGLMSIPMVEPGSGKSRMPITVMIPFAVVLSALRDAGYDPTVSQLDEEEKSDGTLARLELEHDGGGSIRISFVRNE